MKMPCSRTSSFTWRKLQIPTSAAPLFSGVRGLGNKEKKKKKRSTSGNQTQSICRVVAYKHPGKCFKWNTGSGAVVKIQMELQDPALQHTKSTRSQKKIEATGSSLYLGQGHRYLPSPRMSLMPNYLFISPLGQSSAVTITSHAHQFSCLLGEKQNKPKNISFLQRGKTDMIERIICSTNHLLCLVQSSKWFQQDSCLHTLFSCPHSVIWVFTAPCHYHATKIHLWQITAQPSHFSYKLPSLKRKNK